MSPEGKSAAYTTTSKQQSVFSAGADGFSRYTTGSNQLSMYTTAPADQSTYSPYSEPESPMSYTTGSTSAYTATSPEQTFYTTTQKLSVLSGVTSKTAPLQTPTPKPGQSRAEKLKGKPMHTYIELISRALLSSPTLSMSLPEIYDHIMAEHPFYRTSTLAWKNAIRHNLSTNECFVKATRSQSGRGWDWTIHPACVVPFSKGDYRRRSARSRVQHAQAAQQGAVHSLKSSLSQSQSHLNPGNRMSSAPVYQSAPVNTSQYSAYLVGHY